MSVDERGVRFQGWFCQGGKCSSIPGLKLSVGISLDICWLKGSYRQ